MEHSSVKSNVSIPIIICYPRENYYRTLAQLMSRSGSWGHQAIDRIPLQTQNQCQHFHCFCTARFLGNGKWHWQDFGQIILSQTANWHCRSRPWNYWLVHFVFLEYIMCKYSKKYFPSSFTSLRFESTLFNKIRQRMKPHEYRRTSVAENNLYNWIRSNFS